MTFFSKIINIIKTIILVYIIYQIMYIIHNIDKMSKNKVSIKKDKMKPLKNKLYNNVLKSRVNYYINELKKIDSKKYKFLSNTLVIFISIIISIITFFISKHLFQIISTAVIISLISLSIPYILIEQIYKTQKQVIVDNFPMYILTLKNYVYSTNDIILAFRKAKIPKYLYSYISKFNISIEKGISITQAFDELKKDINIEIINDFLSSLLTCHLNGGNVCILLNKYAEILTKINIKRAKEKQNNLSSVVVLFILIIINLFLLFSFVYANENYKEIMTKSIIGNIIINWNVISYFILFILYKNINNSNKN